MLGELLEDTDFLLFDVKHTDAGEHERLTGVSNETILENLRRACERQKPVWIRMPLVPGVTDGEENLLRIAELARELPTGERISLLPYNVLARAKYEQTGQLFTLRALGLYTEERIASIRCLFSSSRVPVEIEG